MLLDIIHDIRALTAGLTRICLCVESAISESARSFVACADVDGLLEELRVTLADGTAVDHDKGAVVTSGGHYSAGHVLVTARNRDVGIMVLGASYRLD
jgi:hypothetical protein